jgi:hypothetical protein
MTLLPCDDGSDDRMRAEKSAAVRVREETVKRRGSQVCSRCQQRKLLEEFYVHPVRPDARRTICRKCMAAEKRTRQSKPEFRARRKMWPSERNRVRHIVPRSKLSPESVLSLRARDKAYRELNPEPFNRRTRAWKERNVDRALEGSNGAGHILRAQKHGVLYERGITRTKIRERDGVRCFYCDCVLDFERVPGSGQVLRNPRYATIDHIVPMSSGGHHVWTNVCLACRACNSGKGYRSPTEWILTLLRRGIVGIEFVCQVAGAAEARRSAEHERAARVWCENVDIQVTTGSIEEWRLTLRAHGL